MITWTLMLSSTLSVTSFKLQSAVEVDMLEQPRKGDFCAMCHDGTEKFLSILRGLQDGCPYLSTTEQCQLLPWAGELQELSLRLFIIVVAGFGIFVVYYHCFLCDYYIPVWYLWEDMGFSCWVGNYCSFNVLVLRSFLEIDEKHFLVPPVT